MLSNPRLSGQGWSLRSRRPEKTIRSRPYDDGPDRLTGRGPACRRVKGSGWRQQVLPYRVSPSAMPPRLFELAPMTKALAAVETDLGRFATLHRPERRPRAPHPQPGLLGRRAEPRHRRHPRPGRHRRASSPISSRSSPPTAACSPCPTSSPPSGASLAEHRGEVTAEVTSAEPLSRQPRRRPEGGAQGLARQGRHARPQVDPSLIGGLIVKVGSRMIDGSLRTKLNSLKLAMKEVG